jgi:hypothetical protein
MAKVSFRFFSILFFNLSTLIAFAQSQKHFRFQKSASIRYDTISVDFMPGLLIREMPKHGADKIEHYVYPEKTRATEKGQSVQSSTLSDMAIGHSYFANPWAISTPNDNDVAISDSGFVVSVINTNIHIRNIVTNTTYQVKSLAAFTSPVNLLHQEFDPKVLYDPDKDRFVLMCMVGFVDSTSKMVLGFSETNDPTGLWNLYVVPGNPLNNNLWSDYPMIALTEKELFLSVNLLTNNSSWQTGFVETIVWQFNKDSAYAGISLPSVLHSGIQFNGKPIRNLCPAKGGSKLYGPNMFFVSNRNFASQNDSIFLVNITDTIGAPGATVTTTVFIADQPYYFPPGGRQKTAVTQTLATNDARNLGAFYENNKIHFVCNSAHPQNSLVTVYYGVMDQPGTANTSVKAYFIPNDTADYAYPNISYAGSSANDHRAIICFDHSSPSKFPGCSVIKTDGLGNFSPIKSIITGTTYVNLLTSNLERWGDYMGSQRRYNNPGEVWISGYYGYRYSGNYPYAHGAWVAQIFRDEDMFTGITNTLPEQKLETRVYPNPTNEFFVVDFSLSAPEYLSFELYDASGKLVTTLLRDWVKVPQNSFSFNPQNLQEGIYFIKISGSTTQISKKIVIQK